MSRTSPNPRTRTRLHAFDGDRVRERVDALATEEPLEIRVRVDGTVRSSAVTMRTPGNDFELAVGFLYGEGVLRRRDDVLRIAYCTDADLDDDQRLNTVTVDVASGVDVGSRLERHFVISSACGVCGRTTLDDLAARCEPVDGRVSVTPEVLRTLPGRLRAAQRVFDRTGGLHAAGLFTSDGDVVEVREDVGRHNALDKLIGRALLDGRLPASARVVLVSGRASYELVQKCVAAGVPVLAAVSAPSSLAVDVARRFGVTLVGFLRGERFNVYTGPERVRSLTVSSG